jgi:pseudouridine synthase, RluA family
LILTTKSSDFGIRLDKFISEKLDITRNAVQKLIINGNVTVNHKKTAKNYRLCENDIIEVILDEPVPLQLEPQDIKIDIIYEDDDLLVVNKPKGMVVHPAPGHIDGTLVNAILFYCKGRLSAINGVIRPGIVHRIDKDTSGLLIVAKNDNAHNNLAEQIKEHTVNRIYEGIVYGNVKKDTGTIDLPIGRDKADRKKMTVTQTNSRNAVTHFEVIEHLKGFTHVRFKLETGRTHQIRVHMSHMGHPIAGDSVYGPKKVIEKLNGQCLHAKSIEFIHPVTKKIMRFDTKLPDYFIKFISANKINFN